MTEAGEAALGRGDWAGARVAFEQALTLGETPEAVYGLARSVEWAGDYALAIGLFEQAYAGLRARGETRLPALIAAREISFLYAAVYGNAAAASGWLQRAISLAEQSGDCTERGWVELACALMTDDPELKERHAAAASAIAVRFGDADLEFDALSHRGTALVLRGAVAEGLRLLDEAATAATNGEVKDYLAIGEIYCKMLVCCELSLDVRRAEQWMDVAERFAHRSHYLPVSAICHMHYGGILIAAGRWAEAEASLRSSVDGHADGYAAMRSGALVRLAGLRVRQGRLAEAERLVTGCEHDAYAVGPISQLHLARGEAELASALLRRHLREAGECVIHAPALALLAEAELAAGRADGALAVSATLEMLAADCELPQMRALAAYSTAISCDEEERYEAALTGFVSAGLPLEEGRCRLALARLLARSRREVAVAEGSRALEIFHQLGAAPHVDEAVRLLRTLGVPAPPGPRSSGPVTRREAEVLRLVTEGLSNEQIARRLYISKRTAEHHVSSLLAKLGAASRAELVARGLREDLAGPGAAR